jgi:hypothetical protein
MKTPFISSGAAILLALSVASCESDGGISGRIQEKSAAYSTLRVTDKLFIQKGVIAPGFTPDMVYMAMGHPTTVESKEYPEGRAELWTYSRYYPNYNAGQGIKHADFTTESAYQPQPAQFQTQMGAYANDAFGAKVPAGMAFQNTPESIGKTGGAQGASMELADLQSYTFVILFKDGKVDRFGAKANPN